LGGENAPRPRCFFPGPGGTAGVPRDIGYTKGAAAGNPGMPGTPGLIEHPWYSRGPVKFIDSSSDTFALRSRSTRPC
jgi:hypothetical protein